MSLPVKSSTQFRIRAKAFFSSGSLGNNPKCIKTDYTIIRSGDRVNKDGETKRVSVVTCGDYKRRLVEGSVRRAIDLLGGIGAFVSPGQKVFLKFNLLQGAAPEKCVTTHPEVVYAVAKVLKEHGCDVILGDSPVRHTLHQGQPAKSVR